MKLPTGVIIAALLAVQSATAWMPAAGLSPLSPLLADCHLLISLLLSACGPASCAHRRAPAVHLATLHAPAYHLVITGKCRQPQLTRLLACMAVMPRQVFGAVTRPLHRGSAPRSYSSWHWQCTATDSTSTDFSSIAAWELEYAEIKKAKGVSASAAEKGGEVLAKSLPGFGAIGSAFERAFNKDADPQQKMMSENELAKQGDKQLDPPAMDSYRVVNTYEHTKESFTQARPTLQVDDTFNDACT